MEFQIKVTKEPPENFKEEKPLLLQRVRPYLSLDLPTDKIFYFYNEEDIDKGSVYYPACLFYKLYKKKEKLGEGTAGIARRYEKRTCGESFAVKITRTRDEEIFSQIKNEFKFMRDVCHKNVIRAFELYYDDIKGKVFYVMEFVEGCNLEEEIQKRGRLNGKLFKRFIFFFLKFFY